MKNKALFLIILLFSSCFQIACFQIAFAATDEGYGEDQTALGQFVDSFENTDNVSVMVNVINNVTLGCMELNYSLADAPVYQNFSEYTEVDSAADITVTERVVTWASMRRDAMSWVVYDFGVDYFGDFTCDFTLDFSDIEAGDTSNRHIMEIIAFSNTIGTFADTIGGDLLCILPRQFGGLDDSYRYDLVQQTGGILDFSISDITNYAMPKHYGTLERSGTTITLRIYTDEARTALIETLTATGNNQKYRYFHVIASYDSVGDGADHSSGIVANVTFEKGAGGYESEGYFTTDDYMNDTVCNGTALGLMVNSSIPYNTDIQVQFSNDNVTWGDWEGIPLDSNILAGGFETIDLRYLNETDVYLRFNLSTTDSSLTPRVYQARIISTIGNQTGGVPPGPSGGGAVGLIMLILICSPLIVLVVWKGRKR